MIELFTIKFGSHLYGTSIPSSDIDYKTIYLPDLKSLLIGEKFTSFKYFPEIKKAEKMQPGEVEIEYIALQTLAKDFFDNQSYALEIVFGFDNKENIIFLNKDYRDLLEVFFNELKQNFLNKNISPIIGYARSQAFKYGLKGKRFNEINHLIEVLEQKENKKVEIREAVYELFDRDKNKVIHICKMWNAGGEEVGGVRIANKVFALNTRLDFFLKSLKNISDKYGDRSLSASEGIDWKALMHAVRISTQALRLLHFGSLKFPLNNASYLQQIRLQAISYEKVLAKLAIIDSVLETAESKSSLKEKTPLLKQQFKTWLSEFMIKFYIS